VTRRDIIVIGGSAGSIEAASAIVRELPDSLKAAVFIVVHVPSGSVSALPRILDRAGRLRAQHAVDGDPIVPGRVYVAPPDYHLVLDAAGMRLTTGPKENRHRPAVDPLFRSAARHYGERVIAVVLSGNQDDGTAGLLRIKQRGGVAVVQNPETALFPSMPRSAVAHVAVDHVADASALAELLVGLVAGEGTPREEVKRPMANTPLNDGDIEARLARQDRRQRPGVPSPMACPECHGVLWEAEESEVLEFRCRVGHGYSADSLLAHQAEQLEVALWTALRALEEHQALARRLAARSIRQGHQHSAAAFTEQAVDAEHHASLIRTALRLPAPEVAVPDDAPAEVVD
jgi:two-component system, chemotaxis family, protein-glutamate methylesterase/glutaminase